MGKTNMSEESSLIQAYNTERVTALRKLVKDYMVAHGDGLGHRMTQDDFIGNAGRWFRRSKLVHLLQMRSATVDIVFFAGLAEAMHMTITQLCARIGLLIPPEDSADGELPGVLQKILTKYSTSDPDTRKQIVKVLQSTFESLVDN